VISVDAHTSRQTEAAFQQAVIEIRMTPPREVWPNTHIGWREKAKAAADFRYQAGLATQIAKLEDGNNFGWVAGARQVMLDVVIDWPKGQRRLDDDNCWASLKAARDGIAEVLEVDDRKMRQGTLRQQHGEGVITVTLREVA
jgi:hypothetical protein